MDLGIVMFVLELQIRSNLVFIFVLKAHTTQKNNNTKVLI